MKLRVHKAKLKALLSKDHVTDINVADSFGWTPMAMAIEIANVDILKKYSDQLSTTALVRRNATKNLENSCFILNQLY